MQKQKSVLLELDKHIQPSHIVRTFPDHRTERTDIDDRLRRRWNDVGEYISTIQKIIPN